MNKYVILLFVCLLLQSAVEAQDCYHKKGIGTWTNPAAGNHWLDSLNLSWYYNWDFIPPADYKGGLEFVPMIWGDYDHYTSDATFRFIKNRDFPALLGFNEPDHTDQSNMTVSRALELWPKLESTGKRLGSPAMAGTAYQENSWLDQFMKIAGAKGLRVDFICVHIYQKNFDINYVLDYCRKTYEKYQKPIWITEWSLANWEATTVNGQATMEQQARYLIQVIKALDTLDYVERHAWFAMWDGHYANNPWPMYMIDEHSEKYTIIGEAMKHVCLTNSFYDEGNLLFNPGFEVPDTGKITGNWDIIPGWNCDGYPVSSGIDQGFKATEGTGYGLLTEGDPSIWQLTDHIMKKDDGFTLTFDVFNLRQGHSLIAGFYYPGDDGERIQLACDTVTVSGTGNEYSMSNNILEFIGDEAPPEAIGRRIGVEIYCPLTGNTQQDSSTIGFDNFCLSFKKVDIVPPDRPDDLVADKSEDSVILDWTGNREADLAYYNIYRSENSGTGYYLIASGIVTDYFVDHDLQTATGYYYVVSAVDLNGNESEFSSEAYVNTSQAGMEQASLMTGISIYPNPFDRDLTVSVPDYQFVNIEIDRLDGTLVLGKTVNARSAVKLDSEQMTGGIYILKVIQRASIQTFKIIKL